jgi:L-ascorbate metabolism protein UlaG (beta-lactamase superfamily)
VKMPLGRPSLRPYLPYKQRASPHRDGLTARFLGTSSVLLSDGETSVLIDGFVTRPSMRRVVTGRIAPDPRLVRGAIDRLGVERLAAVICAHSHYDHALDAPVWALETGAQLVGSESTANIGRGLGVPKSSLRVVEDGETIAYGRFELTFVNSRHSPGDIARGTVHRPLVPPAWFCAWKTGTVYSILITHPRGRVLVHASANYRVGSLRGLEADVVYLGIATLGKLPAEFLHAYWHEVVTRAKARRVILVHWDDLFLGLDRPLRPLPYLLDDLDTTMRRLLNLASIEDVEIVLPVHWQRSDPLAALT